MRDFVRCRVVIAILCACSIAAKASPLLKAQKHRGRVLVHDAGTIALHEPDRAENRT